MMMSDLGLSQQLETLGYAGRSVPIERLADLRQDVEEARRDGLIDGDLYREYLSGFVYGPPAGLPGARSVIVVAVRQSPVRFTFQWKGKTAEAIVPPTYLRASDTDRKAQDTLAGLLSPGGFRVTPAALPKKLLAVRSGLAAYGRNNITYVPGFGSYHRLAAFFSDRPSRDGAWHHLRMMDRCVKCRLCPALCPTGAIVEDRFRIRAERCLVYHNEKPAVVPFAPWISPAWHNCLVGCMACQRACPENADFAQSLTEGGSFSEEETRLLLAGTPQALMPAGLLNMLKESDLAGLLDVLSRNLRALL